MHTLLFAILFYGFSLLDPCDVDGKNPCGENVFCEAEDNGDKVCRGNYHTSRKYDLIIDCQYYLVYEK